MLEHVEDTLNGQESVWVLLLADAFEEDWQVVVVVELRAMNLPVNCVLRAVFNGDRQVTAVVETTELARSNHAAGNCACLWLLDLRSRLGLVGAERLAAQSVTFLKHYKIRQL